MDSETTNLLREGNVGRLLLRAARDFSWQVAAKLCARDRTDLKIGHTVLIANLDSDGTRITTLAERTGMTKQAMSQLVKEMEESGYLRREQDAADKRAMIITPTLRGLEVLRDVQEIVGQIEVEYVAVLGEKQMQNLRAALLRLSETPKNSVRTAQK